MSRLEARGYLDHPHTSAGRVPTRLGYQAYVDELMVTTVLNRVEKNLMQTRIRRVVNDSTRLFRESSRLLARLSHLLGVVLSPQMKAGVLERLDVVPVSSDRVLFVISVRGGLVRTIVFTVAVALKRDRLEGLVALLNERLVGLTLDEIRRTCVPRVQDLRDEETGIVQLILDETRVLFSDPPEGRTVEVDGATFMLAQPEFTETKRVRGLVELLEDDASVVRLLEQSAGSADGQPWKAQVYIGQADSESTPEELKPQHLSVVTAQYQRSDMRGTIGVIGPIRMDYARIITLVENVAQRMSWPDPEPSESGAQA